ncbi:MAG: tryptophan--tRNA ligase [Anaerolineales bacterium]
MKRIFSGIQPSGNTHIGNLLGVIRHWAAHQAENDNLFCIVDLHAITIPKDPSTLRAHTCEVAGLLIAAGISPEQSTVFVQSHVSAHAELAWILNCVIPMGWMSRMTQYKEKSKKQKEGVSVGLFDYPALMAADILLYQTHQVPVGEDQKQHVELTRDAAQRFNNLYGETFTLPEPVIAAVGARIMGLDDPTQKMSKSNPKPEHAVFLLDPPDEVRRKIMRAKTDSQSGIVFNESRPAIYNLLTLFELTSGLERDEIETHFAGKGYADLKRELADAMIEYLRPLQARYTDLMADPATLDGILKEGAERARALAEPTLKDVMQKIGLG